MRSMIIAWLGQACFKIQTESKTIVIDPYDAKVGFALPICHADMVLVTHGHFDHSNSAAFPDVKHIIAEPGNYEFEEVVIRGIQTFHDAVQGKLRGLNTMYKIDLEGLSLLHMGDYGESELRQETVQEIGKVDILMIPVGGTYTIDGSEAAALARQIGAKIIIPMHYLTPGLIIPLAGPELFLENMGASDAVPQKQLEITKDDLARGDQNVALLSRAV